MKIRVDLDHAALTASGKGTENFTVKQSKQVPGMFCLTFYPRPKYGGVRIDIYMDAVTMTNLSEAVYDPANAHLEKEYEREHSTNV